MKAILYGVHEIQKARNWSESSTIRGSLIKYSWSHEHGFGYCDLKQEKDFLIFLQDWINDEYWCQHDPDILLWLKDNWLERMVIYRPNAVFLATLSRKCRSSDFWPVDFCPLSSMGMDLLDCASWGILERVINKTSYLKNTLMASIKEWENYAMLMICTAFADRDVRL